MLGKGNDSVVAPWVGFSSDVVVVGVVSIVFGSGESIVPEWSRDDVATGHSV